MLRVDQQAGERDRDRVATRPDQADEQQLREEPARTSTLCTIGSHSGKPDATAMAP